MTTLKCDKPLLSPTRQTLQKARKNAMPTRVSHVIDAESCDTQLGVVVLSGFCWIPEHFWVGQLQERVVSRQECTELGVCDFSWLLWMYGIVPVKFGDDRLSGCCT